MASVPMNQGLLLAGILFALGLTGLLVRRNMIFILMSLEIMLNAAGWPLSWPAPAGARRTDRSCSFLFLPWRPRRCRWGWRWFCRSTAASRRSTRMLQAR